MMQQSKSGLGCLIVEVSE